MMRRHQRRQSRNLARLQTTQKSGLGDLWWIPKASVQNLLRRHQTMLQILADRQVSFIPTLLPRRPYCTDDLESGLRIRSLSAALKARYIQVNPPHLRVFSLFDIDRPWGGLAWEDCDLPPPTWAAINKVNSHAHLAYQLSAPVLIKGEGLHQKPLRWLVAIERAMSEILRADPGFAGLITKNPKHPDWQVLTSGETYELADLAEYIPDLGKYRYKPRGTVEVGLGRNCSLFDWLRRQAYREVKGWKRAGQGAYVQYLAALYHTALNRNEDFSTPLNFREVHWIAKSVAHWTWGRFDIEASDQRFSQRQARRGRRGGVAKGEAYEDKRASARLMRAAGHSYQQIADKLEASRRAVIDWCK